MQKKAVVEVCCIVSFQDAIFQFGLRYVNFFEPLGKVGISYYLNSQLKKYRKQGRVLSYDTKTQRLGKWHYKIEVYLDITPKQFVRLMKELSRQIPSLGRR